VLAPLAVTQIDSTLRSPLAGIRVRLAPLVRAGMIRGRLAHLRRR
jgi:hypothetical protein